MLVFSHFLQIQKKMAYAVRRPLVSLRQLQKSLGIQGDSYLELNDSIRQLLLSIRSGRELDPHQYRNIYRVKALSLLEYNVPKLQFLADSKHLIDELPYTEESILLMMKRSEFMNDSDAFSYFQKAVKCGYSPSSQVLTTLLKYITSQQAFQLYKDFEYLLHSSTMEAVLQRLESIDQIHEIYERHPMTLSLVRTIIQRLFELKEYQSGMELIQGYSEELGRDWIIATIQEHPLLREYCEQEFSHSLD
jgi:hypothetical protein